MRGWKEDANGNFVSGDRAAYEWCRKKTGDEKAKSIFGALLIWLGIIAIAVLIGLATGQGTW